MAGSSSRSGAIGRELECVDFVQEKSSGADLGDKSNGRFNQVQEYSSTQITSKLQHERIEDGYFDNVVDVVPRRGDNKGDAVVDGMEFEVGSGAATISC